MFIIYIFFLFVLIILWGLFKPLKVSEIWTAPGSILSVDPIINAKEIRESAQTHPTNLYMTYVKRTQINSWWERIVLGYYGYTRTSITRLYASESESDFTERDLTILGKELIPYMKHNIVKAALVHENIDLPEEISKPVVVFHPEKFKTGQDLKVGDEVLFIDDIEVDSPEDINFYLESFNIGDTVDVIVHRQRITLEIPVTIKELDRHGKATLGVYLKNQFVFEGLSVDNIIHLDNNYSGESGGFMLALGLIQQLDPNVDLARGRKVAGTGGITRGGDIQPISNLDLKLLTAKNEKVDVFIYPKYQDQEVAKAKATYNLGDLELVGVRNLREAIAYLSQ
ncbi:PDZ domain-containing secreted protein [Paenibacillus sp. OK060]|uniref:S16 family serine protease n=1 Tax=Paenibacillus sp. OK060 TaxID=1881034 RepID=UPI0008864E0E|nr:S16 family serine protease [Paenibacillus sp. OK060]SDM14855.1 PDZ domain-containing secreted protein [Paenibacillus sp. OK060]